MQIPELDELYELIDEAQGFLKSERLCIARTPEGYSYPVLGLRFGSEDPTSPCLGIFAGVHGLERIGTQTAIAFLKSLVQNMSWDRHLRERLERTRIVAIPIVNPGGMARLTRANPRGVDLMRNSPVEAESAPPPLLGGHRLSPFLPWFRGNSEHSMEPEAQAVVDFVKREMLPAPVSLALDIHSGFGATDRLWYPYAYTRAEFPRTPECRRIARLLDSTYPHHIYKIEPQSLSYTTHGDLWDFIFKHHETENTQGEKIFIPWTLEMGSWKWVRKNPRQLLSVTGIFNPILDHRVSRVLRRHLLLIDFLHRAVDNPEAWMIQDQSTTMEFDRSKTSRPRLAVLEDD